MVGAKSAKEKASHRWPWLGWSSRSNWWRSEIFRWMKIVIVLVMMVLNIIWINITIKWMMTVWVMKVNVVIDSTYKDDMYYCQDKGC